ncbi:MAG: ATP-binding protein [Desulfobacterium sp.]|jgi:two-component system sensor histidine kinase HydH|nr:ATP-binding protein [Desulfobacterium sp.]
MPDFKKISDPKKRTIGISPFIISGVLLVLMSIFVLMAMDNIKEHDARVVEKLTAKGTFLIRAFEAGTRTGMMTMKWRAPKVQSLLSETAFLPEVSYLMITTLGGKILAHSDPEKIGTVYAGMPETDALGDGTAVSHRRVIAENRVKTFEVFKVFTPARRFHGPGRGMPMGRKMAAGKVQGISRAMGEPSERTNDPELPGLESPGPELPAPELQDLKTSPGDQAARHPSHNSPGSDWFSAHFSRCPDDCLEQGPQIIIAGLDMEEAEFGKKEYVNHIVVNGIVLFLIAGSGIVGLFMLQGYRSTRSSLSRVRAFSNNLVETMPAGLIAVDHDFGITSCNREAMVILGEWGKPVLPPVLVQMAGTIRENDQKISREVALSSLSGRILVLDVVVSPIPDDGQGRSGYLFLFRDLTELAALKHELERSRRLAAVGKLAAGVAHEIRNPLSSIKGFATYFRERYRDVVEDKTTADIMIHEVERLNRAVTQLLEFATPLPVVARRVDVKNLVDHSLKLVEKDLADRSIKIEKIVQTDQTRVITDPDRLNQVLLNLYLNAIQAMDKGGILEVRAIVERGCLSVAVKDTGSGIARADMEKIFDPYYTTRAKGTGLGLAMVHRNLEAMGGDIRVESQEGKGTTFFINIACGNSGEND